jgi:hypothetical protein
MHKLTADACVINVRSVPSTSLSRHLRTEGVRQSMYRHNNHEGGQLPLS